MRLSIKPVTILVVTAFVFFMVNEISSFWLGQEKAKQEAYEYDKRIMDNLINAQKESVEILAEALSVDGVVRQAYRENDPETIRRHVMPIWKRVREKQLVYEIHFFKPPAVSFVNFSNFASIGNDVKKVRKDIQWVTTSFKPSSHALMCKSYAGILATHPVIDDDGTMLGGLSLGKKLDWLPQTLKSRTGDDAFIVYTRQAAEVLTQKYYQDFMQNKQRVGDFILADLTAAFPADQVAGIDFTKSVQEMKLGDKKYSLNIYPIEDFNKETMGYVCTLNGLDVFYDRFSTHIVKNFILVILTSVLIYLIMRHRNSLLLSKVRQIAGLSRKIREKDFAELHAMSAKSSVNPGAGALERLENDIVDMGLELEAKYSQLESALENEVKRLNQAQFNANMGSYDLNLQTNEVDWSDGHYRVLGLDKKGFEPTLQKFLSFIHPKDLAFVLDELDRAVKTGENIMIDYRIVLPSKEVRFIRSSAKVYRYGRDGTPLRMSGTVQDITPFKKLELENEKKRLQLTKQIYTDNLTGLPNLNALTRDMKAYPDGHLAIINIRAFSHINDVFGFEAGNFVLRDLGRRFAPLVKNRGLVMYRIGSDEAVIFNKNVLSKEAFVDFIADMIRRLEQEIFYYPEEEVELSINVYAGLCLDRGRRLEKADMALSQANREFKDYVIYSEHDDTKRLQEKNLEMIDKIKTALNNDAIVNYYQPIVDAEGKTLKYEVLVRLLENGSVLRPSEFLGIAKKTKYYHKITYRVVYNAFKTFKQRSDAFSVNLTAEDILNQQVVSFIKMQLLAFADPQRVVFEIVESEDIYNLREIESFITEIKAMGAKIAIDDFGTGYSNFSYMMKIRPDYLKIDGSLIRNLDSDSNALKIVKTIVVFANELGVKTIAEFVDTEKIFAICKSLGIDEYQGYYFGHPVGEV